MKKEVVEEFSSLFRGLARAYGITKPGPEHKKDPTTNKLPSKSWTVLKALQKANWKEHLEGKIGLGIAPIDDDANVPGWGCIDVDTYNLDLIKLSKKIHEKKLPLVVCRSKSGGAHIFIFLSEPVSAQLVRTKLTELAIALDFPGVEVFPKQISLANEKDVGSWLNLPYFGSNDSNRYAIINGRKTSVEDFLVYARTVALSAEQFVQLNIPIASSFVDGPPCLQQLATHGFPKGTRNNSLFSIGVYCKLKWPDEWEKQIEEYNVDLMEPPLRSNEVQAVIKGLQKKDYFYKCNDQPIQSCCNKGLCLVRKFGIGTGDESGDVQIGGLTKYLTIPPVYILDVDGHRVELNTDELLNNGKFRARVFEKLNKLPPRRKAIAWDKVVQQLAINCVEIEAPSDASLEGRIYQALEDWCTQYATARTKEELLVGKPWFDEKGAVYFRSTDFIKYLEAQNIREAKGKALWAILKRYGAEHGQFKLENKCVRYWCLPPFGEEIPEESLEQETLLPIHRKIGEF